MKSILLMHSWNATSGCTSGESPSDAKLHYMQEELAIDLFLPNHATMTIVNGKVGALKDLRKSLRERGIDRFNSVGDINRFRASYEAEKAEIKSRVERTIEAELKEKQSALLLHQQFFNDLTAKVRDELEREIQSVESARIEADAKICSNILAKYLNRLTVRHLSRKKARIEKAFESNLAARTRRAQRSLNQAGKALERFQDQKAAILSERCRFALENLNFTKQSIDDLYALVAGAIGESAVVKILEQLSDDYYLINDFSMRFDPPIFNRNEKDRIFSVQIDHLLICPSGIFILETKNWSKESINSLNLRSPVQQIRRTNFALFVFMNSDPDISEIPLEGHHWGDRKIPIRNVIVMINEKPKEEFKHVKVVTLNELVGYISYFDSIFTSVEVKGMFEYLKISMRMESR